jgi:2'-hydroxyisoflavone reductase
MKILILGGTRFLGRYLVKAALERNHEVTLFNRGTYPSPAGVESIVGDRKNDLTKLAGRRWDAVIDTCGYLPRTVKAAAEVLRDSVNSYIFISSQSAYADVSSPGVSEDSQLKTLTSDQLMLADEIDSSAQASAVNFGSLYGGLKALCEQAVEEMLPNRVLIIRPGLIVGPDDYTDRFTYWVSRVARGGEVLAPGRSDRFIQFIDVRDLSDWTVEMTASERTGIYNAAGLSGKLTMGMFLNECKNVSESDASFTWADEEFLLKEQVAAWSEMPLWLPEDAAPYLRGFMFINTDKAVGDGLRFRSVTETIRDTLRWYQNTQPTPELQAGISRTKEDQILETWHHRS